MLETLLIIYLVSAIIMALDDAQNDGYISQQGRKYFYNIMFLPVVNTILASVVTYLTIKEYVMLAYWKGKLLSNKLKLCYATCKFCYASCKRILLGNPTKTVDPVTGEERITFEIPKL